MRHAAGAGTTPSLIATPLRRLKQLILHADPAPRLRSTRGTRHADALRHASLRTSAAERRMCVSC